MKVARTCAPASARLSLQAMRLSYFKNDFTSSLQRNIMLRVSSLSKLFYRKSSRAVCALRDL